jgi:hypothetical protein
VRRHQPQHDPALKKR